MLIERMNLEDANLRPFVFKTASNLLSCLVKGVSKPSFWQPGLQSRSSVKAADALCHCILFGFMHAGNDNLMHAYSLAFHCYG
jgi:hypothetical protein